MADVNNFLLINSIMLISTDVYFKTISHKRTNVQTPQHTYNTLFKMNEFSVTS